MDNAIIVIIITSLITVSAASGFIWFLLRKAMESNFTIKNLMSSFELYQKSHNPSQAMESLKQIGTDHFIFSVNDGHEQFYSRGGKELTSQAKYPHLTVSSQVNLETLKQIIASRNSKAIPFEQFCQAAAQAGVNYWKINVGTLTCTYCDLSGKEIHTEQFTDKNIMF